MVWDKNNPISTTIVSSSCTTLTGNFAAIAEFCSAQHASVMATTITHSAGECSVMLVGTTTMLAALTPVACAIGYNTTLNDLYTWTAVASSNRGGFVPSGTKMLFYQDTAPTGWTMDSTLDEKLAFVTSGSSPGQVGGIPHTTGAWRISGITGSASDHTLTIAEYPAHVHSMQYQGTYPGWYESFETDPHNLSDHSAGTTSTCGGGGAHKHALSSMVFTGSDFAMMLYTSTTYYTITPCASENDSIHFNTNLAADTDFLFVGVDSKFDQIQFIVNTANDVVAVLSADYCSGNNATFEWKSVALTTDGTSGALGKPFSQSGDISFTPPGASWSLESVNSSRDLYWIRLSVDANLTAAANGKCLRVLYPQLDTPGWRPPAYCCIVCTKD